jgi:hypothetical protein
LGADASTIQQHDAVGVLSGQIQLVGRHNDSVPLASRAREQVKDLEFQLRTMTQSRNEFQNKNAEMIKQMNYWKKRAEKAEKK